MTRLRRDSGQAAVVTILFLTVLLGMTAAVLDVGAWFRTDRKLQANTDAAALAGAQALPEDTGLAAALALEYAGKNGGDVDGDDISFTTTVVPNDTIVIESEKNAPGVFTGMFGLDSVEVHGKARARTGTISSALYVAPIVVNWQHPMLTCKPKPCFNQPAVLEYYHLKQSGPSGPMGAGSFGFINLGVSGSNPGTSQLREQIANGFNDYMDLGAYNARTGNPFSAIKDVLELRKGEEMLFPIFRTLSGTGSNAKYDIIGWVGFVITDMELAGNKEKFYGYFKRVIWQGIASQKPSQPSFGAYSVELIE